MAGTHMKRRSLLLAAGLAAPIFGASAQSAPTLIPRRLLFAAPERTRVTISPDGKLVAFLGPVDGVLNVWLAPIADPAAARPLTRITDRDVLNRLYWPHDNRHLVFFREQGGDENWQAHRIDIETGDIRALTPGPGVRSYVKQVSARFPGELLFAHNQRDKRYFDVYRVNIATGDSTLVYRNDSFAWIFTDPQFRCRWGGRYRDDGGWDAVTIEDGRAGALFRRVEAEDAFTTAMVEIADDEKELFWLDSQGRDRAAVVAQDLASGRFRVLAEDPSADFAEPTLDPVSCVPIAAPVVYERRRWQVLDQSAAADMSGWSHRARASLPGSACRTTGRAGSAMPSRPARRDATSTTTVPAAACAGCSPAGLRSRPRRWWRGRRS